MCGYTLATKRQNFTEIHLAEVKILQKVVGGATFLTDTVDVYRDEKLHWTSHITSIIVSKKYVLWDVYLPNALHSVCLNRLSCTEVGIYNGANSPNGFRMVFCTLEAQCLLFSDRLTHRL